MTVEQLRRHLLLWDDDSYDVELSYLLTVAQNHVEDHLGKKLADMETVPPVVSHAILMTAGELFEVRTESTDAKSRLAAICVSRLLAANRRVTV